MSLIERAKNICFSPASEWTVIAGESTPPATLVTGYAAPLAAIGAVAGFIGGSVIGRTVPFVGTFRVGLVPGLVGAVFMFGLALLGIAILSVIINALAPTFGAQKDSVQALKLAVYSYTPAWIAGVLNIVPLLGVLALFAGLYGIYLMYLGLPRLMKCPLDKAAGYTVVVVVCAIVLSVVVGLVGATVTGVGMVATGGLGGSLGNRTASTREVQVDKDSPLGKLQEFGKKLEESNKKMEAASKAGNQSGQVAAAVETLGTIFGGGKRVEPIGIEELKPFVPATFIGLPKTRSSAEKNGIAGLMVSKAEATYGDGQKTVTLEISDTGGVSGLVSLAGWVGVQEEKEDENGFERTRKVSGRLVHEKQSKNGGTNEYGIVLGDRFMVAISSRQVDLDTLKSAVSTLNLGKLESMKNAGVQQ